MYFDPHSEGDMRSKVEMILASDSLRRDLVSRGRERAKMFSWERTADLTRQVYEKALGV